MYQLAEKLKAKDLKVTPQRLAIYQILYNTKEHPSAEQIYQKLVETHPTVSLATVYKTLDALKKKKLIHELNVGEDSFRYDANLSSHPHGICLRCNQVYDLDIDMNAIIAQVQQKTDFEIESQQVYFYGCCPHCK